MDEAQVLGYKTVQKFLRPILNTFTDTSIQNPQNVPEEGACLLVANHRSDQDPFMIMTNVRRPINWLGAKYLWNIPLAHLFFDGIGAIPVSKYKSEIRKAFEKAKEVLKAGQMVGIFPEGWNYIADNQFDWSVGEFQTGFARIAIETGAPVLPVALLGLDEVRGIQSFPPFIRKLLDYPLEMQYIKGRVVYRKLHINVGKPIPPPVGADPNDREAVNNFTRLVNDTVIDLYNSIPNNIIGFENIEPKTAGPEPPPPPEPELEIEALLETEAVLELEAEPEPKLLSEGEQERDPIHRDKDPL